MRQNQANSIAVAELISLMFRMSSFSGLSSTPEMLLLILWMIRCRSLIDRLHESCPGRPDLIIDLACGVLGSLLNFLKENMDK